MNTASTGSGDIIRFRDIALGALKTLPDSMIVNKGLVSLISLRPHGTGSIGQLLQEQAARHPEHTALLFEDRRWSYAEFNAWVNRIAASFRSRGIRRGDAVAILMENRPESLACVAATVKLGAIAGMLNFNQRGDVLAHSIKLVNPKIVVVGEECVEALKTTPFTPDKDSSRIYFWEGGKNPKKYLNLRDTQALMPPDNPPEALGIPLKSPAFYIFTSGTTGMPKASVMTHYRWLRGSAGLGLMAVRMRSDDIFYCPLPLYHNNALTVSWGSVLSAGATLALGRKFSASKFWDEIRRFNATSFCYIGELCRYLINQPPHPRDRDHRVRLMIGNGLRPEIWEEFQTRFGIERVNEFYGASESNAAFVNGFGLNRTVGFCPLTFAIVEFDADAEQPVRDRRGFMKKVGKGGVGLLVTEISDRNPFDGYTDQKASESKLFRNVFKKGDCWFNSGDLVKDQGYRHIQFVDRVGDTFRWKGENVATTEVEGAINRFPGIEQAVVYGVQVPGCDGRAGMAALTVQGGKLDGEALAQHLAAALPAYAVPLFLRMREEQEVTGTFKFRKVELKKEAFNPGLVSEPLMVLLDRGQTYVPLTPAIYEKIQNGAIRF